MIVQDFYLKQWDWQVRVYYFVDDYYYDYIVEDLKNLGASDVEHMVHKLASSGLNSGLTFSSPIDRSSVVVIGETTSNSEFQSTLDHEKGHLCVHIALFDNIDFISEEFQYLAGEIGKQMYPVAKYFLCEHCSKDVKTLVGTLVYNE